MLPVVSLSSVLSVEFSGGEQGVVDYSTVSVRVVVLGVSIVGIALIGWKLIIVWLSISIKVIESHES